MNWRILRRPDAVEGPQALGLWMLGTLWALGLLGVLMRGESHLVPLMLGAGPFLVWAWRRARWIVAIPSLALLSLAGDQLALAGAPRRIGHLDALVALLALLAIARILAAQGRESALPPGQRLLPLPVALGAVTALLLQGVAADALRPVAIGAALFFVCRISAAASRWAWPLTLATAGVCLGLFLTGSLQVAPAFAQPRTWLEDAPTRSSTIPLLSMALGLTAGLLWPSRPGKHS